LRSDPEWNRALRISAIAHGTALLLLLVDTVFLHETPKPYIPSLKVDLVALPDVLKQDHRNMTTSEPADAPGDTGDTGEMKVATPSAKRPAKPAANASKIKNALAKIRALEKISGDGSGAKPRAAPVPLIKGNKLSAGTSTTGDARESAESSYYDLVRDHLQDHWSLPVFLARQGFAAQVLVTLDARGNLIAFKFTKPPGSAPFDEAVKNTLTSAQPFPKPPASLLGSVATRGILVGFPL